MNLKEMLPIKTSTTKPLATLGKYALYLNRAAVKQIGCTKWTTANLFNDADNPIDWYISTGNRVMQHKNNTAKFSIHRTTYERISRQFGVADSRLVRFSIHPSPVELQGKCFWRLIYQK